MGQIISDVVNNVLRHDPRQRPILEFFLHDFDVTWATRKVGHGTSLLLYFLKPSADVEQLFGLSTEIVMAYSPYSSIQARTLMLVQKALNDTPDSMRVDPLILLLVSPASDLEEETRKIMTDTRQSRIIIPFQQSECLREDRSTFVRQRLQRYLFNNDLFDVTQPISSDLYFFGRRSLVVELRESVRSGDNIGLFGLRKTGKTSVLLRLKRTLDHDGRGKLCYLDLQDQALYRLRWWQLLDKMRAELAGGSASIAGSEETSAALFRDSVALLGKKHPNRKVIFALDEIEHITPKLSMKEHWHSDFLDLWKTLRAVQNTNRNITFIVAGVNATCVETSTFSGHDNPLFSMVKIRYMPPFDAAEIGTMTRTLGRLMGLNFTEHANTYLLNSFGGHPLLIRLACSWAHKNLDKAERPVEITSELFAQHQTECHSHLWPWGDHVLGMLKQWYPNEHHMLHCLAKGKLEEYQEYADEMPQTVEHLKAYRLIGGNPARLTIPFLIQYLKGNKSGMKAADAVKGAEAPDVIPNEDLLEVSRLRNRLEPKLRRFIKRVLKSYYGPDKWITPVLAVVPTAERDKLAGVDRNVILNERLFLLNLLGVMQANWEQFKGLEATVPAKRVTKNNVSTILDFVNSHREDAHAKPISPADLATLKIAVGALEAAIDEFLRD
jgi:hypothetical protein